MKIGVILNKYPVKSETFIQSFLHHLKNQNLFIFVSLEQKTKISHSIFVPYINGIPKSFQILQYFDIVLKSLFYLDRFIYLKRKGLPFKQIVHDANIWTTKSLDILHFPFANSAFGREYYAEMLGAKMSISFRGSDINVFPFYHKVTYEKLWPFVHKVHCNSNELAMKIAGHSIPPFIPVAVIHPALRNDFEGVEEKALCKIDLGTSFNPLVISTIGRLHWVKDYPLAIRSMAVLKEYGFYFKYHILGDGIEREQLMFLIHELGLDDEIYLHGVVDSVEINNILKQTHIYLQTSLAEGFSNACLEAQAFGLPCIVPNISGMSVCIEDGKTGIIVKDRRELSFVESIVYIMKNINHYNSTYISSRIKRDFSIQKQRDQWLHFFDQLLLQNSY